MAHRHPATKAARLLLSLIGTRVTQRYPVVGADPKQKVLRVVGVPTFRTYPIVTIDAGIPLGFKLVEVPTQTALVTESRMLSNP